MKAMPRQNTPHRDHAQHEPAQQREYISPEVDIFETGEGYVLRAEMPGVNKTGLEVTLEENEVSITGHRQVPSLDAQPLLAESRNMNYRRVFELDPAIDTSRITAKMDQGVLTLTLPKSEKVKPRKITVD